MSFRASICSLILMIPISAVTDDPALPVTIRAEMTGPISLMSESPTIGPRKASEPNRLRVLYPWKASTMPVKAPVRKMTDRDWNPMKRICFKTREIFKGGVREKKNPLTRKIPMRPSLWTRLSVSEPSDLTKSMGLPQTAFLGPIRPIHGYS